MSRLRDLLGLCNVPAREIAAADVEYLALAAELFHGLPEFLPGTVTIDVMHLVKIDVVCLQPTEAFFAGPLDMKGRQSRLVGPVAHAAIDLGGQHDLVAPPAALRQPAPDDLFGDAFADFPSIH